MKPPKGHLKQFCPVMSKHGLVRDDRRNKWREGESRIHDVILSSFSAELLLFPLLFLLKGIEEKVSIICSE